MNIKEILKDYRRRAKRALDKPAEFGADINIRDYVGEASEPKVKEDEVDERIRELGIDTHSIGARYVLIDKYVKNLYSKIKGVRLYSLEEAIEEIPDTIKNYYWKLIPVDQDKYTATAELYGEEGYVILVEDNVKVDMPIQTCLLLSKNKFIQAPHNLIIVGDNSRINITTGCTIIREVASIHAEVTEIYIGNNSEVRYLMIHGWSSLQHVRPRTAIVLGDNSRYIDYYISFSPSKTLQMYPRVYLKGKNSKALTSSVIVAKEEEDIDIGAEAVLEGERSGAELVSRVIAKNRSRMVTRSRIVAKGDDVKGHIECDGILLSETAEIITIPELIALNDNVSLTHEASVGKLAEDQIIYLMSKGFTEDEAKELLIRGFMKVKIPGLSEPLEKAIEQAITIASRGL